MFSSVQEPFKTMPLTTDWSHVGCTKQETDYHIRICGVDYDVNTSRYVGICLSVCLFGCLSVQIRVWPIIFWLYSWSRYFALWPQGRVFDMSTCPTHNFCLVGFWQTIFSTWVYHHGRMCCVYSWSQYDVGLWPKCQIYRIIDMPLCLGHSFSVLLQSHTTSGTWVYH